MKYLFAIAALLLCCRAVSCEIPYATSADIAQVVQRHGFDFHGHDDVCKKLQAAHAQLIIDAIAFVDKDGRTLGFADVFVAAIDGSAMSEEHRMAYASSIEVPTPESKDKVINSAVETALSGIDDDIDGYLTTIKLHERMLQLAQPYMRDMGKNPK